jgi:excisionase family DNA binding protein
MSALNERRLYTKLEASQILGISVYTLDRIVKAGEIGTYTVGRRIRFAEHHLAVYLESSEQTPRQSEAEE